MQNTRLILLNSCIYLLVMNKWKLKQFLKSFTWHSKNEIHRDKSGKNTDILCSRGFPGGSGVKNLPAMQEVQVWSMGGEDPLEEGMAIHSSILAWIITWTEEPGGLQSIVSWRGGHNWSDLARTHCVQRSETHTTAKMLIPPKWCIHSMKSQSKSQQIYIFF